MECLITFLFLVILIGVTMTFAARSHAGADRWNRASVALARKYGGWHKSGGWFGQPVISFYYGGAAVEVNFLTGGRPKGRYLQIKITYPDPHFRCEAFPRRVSRGMDNPFVAAGVEAEYTIRYENQEMMQRFFSDGVQLQLNRMRYLLGNDDIYLSVQRGTLLIKKAMPRHGGVDQIQELVRLALELYDQALLARNSSIKFVEHQTLQTIEGCICKVCGDELADDVVFCVRCKTPHHRDCWIYNGECSTYGCKTAEFVVPRVAQPLPGPPRSPESASLE